MQRHPEILIVGGGVIGLTTALNLARFGVSVTVVDRQEIGREASWAGAGMLPPGNLTNAQTSEARLRSLSHELWDDLAAELKERTGIDNGYRRCGSVELCTSGSKDAFNSQLTSWQQEGIIVQNLKRSELEIRVPDLHPDFDSGVFLPQFGQVRNPRHLKALAVACQNLGVEIIEGVQHLSLSLENGDTVTASSESRKFAADRICITAGSWTPHLLESLGVTIPVKPVRGQMVQLRTQRLPFACVIELGRRYIVPRADGLILVGSTQEYVGFEKKTTSDGVSGLLTFAESIVPELGQAEVVRCWAGLRPGSPDELPFLGRVTEFDNLYVGAGHFRSGLQMSPGTGAILGDLLIDRTPPINLEGLTLERLMSTGA